MRRCTDAEAAPRRLARSQHIRHIGVTRNNSPTLMSNWQVCCPSGHHRFGFSSRHHRLDKYEPVTPLQMVARRSRCTRPSFNSSERSTSQRNNLRTSGHQRATNFFKSARRVALEPKWPQQLYTRTMPTPPTATMLDCALHTSAIRSSQQKTKRWKIIQKDGK